MMFPSFLGRFVGSPDGDWAPSSDRRLRHDWMIVSVMYSSLFLVRHRIAHAPSEHWPPSSNCIIWDRLGNETYLERDMNSYPIYSGENLCKRARDVEDELKDVGREEESKWK